jgi:serine/threonine protein kinase
MTHCPSPELLQQWLADRLSGPEGEAIETHIERCPTCQQALERLTGSAGAGPSRATDSPGESGAAFLYRLEREPPTEGPVRPSAVGAVETRPAPSPTAPPTVPGYEILEELGHGGMGVVYKARDSRLNRNVALKFLPQEVAGDTSRQERFRREALAISKLNHPFICTLHDVGEFQGHPFLVMEWIEGRTLRNLVGQRPPLEEFVRLVGQVAQALQAAHAARIVHRDIKPENIMVRADGYVKLVDFGLARGLPALLLQPGDPSAITELGTLVGTLRYLSPEQARAEPVGAATDIFSLGIVLYELATGRHPFPAASNLGFLHSIVSQSPLPASRLNPAIPAGLEELLQQMLAKEAYLRPTAAAVAAALAERVGGTGGVSAGPAQAPLAPPPAGGPQERREPPPPSPGKQTPGRPRKGLPSLAILPLRNAGADPNLDYLSDGITESLIHLLSLLPELKVMARSTVFRYKGQVVDAQEVGRALKVRAVLTGELLQRGNRLILRTELVNVRDGARLWRGCGVSITSVSFRTSLPWSKQSPRKLPISCACV